LQFSGWHGVRRMLARLVPSPERKASGSRRQVGFGIAD
jgi:hypothetical protein